MHGWLMRTLGQAYILGHHHRTLLADASETALFHRMPAFAPHAATTIAVCPVAAAVWTFTITAPARVS